MCYYVLVSVTTLNLNRTPDCTFCGAGDFYYRKTPL